MAGNAFLPNNGLDEARRNRPKKVSSGYIEDTISYNQGNNGNGYAVGPTSSWAGPATGSIRGKRRETYPPPSMPSVPSPPHNPFVKPYDPSSAPMPPQSGSAPTPPSPNIPGYQGGGNYYDLNQSGRSQMEQDRARVKSDPAFRQSEIDRTLGVIRGLGNADTSAQKSYLSFLGYQSPRISESVPTPGTPPAFVPPPPGPGIPSYQPAIPAMDEAAIRAYAQKQVENKLTQLRQSADQSIRSGQTTADQQLKSLGTQFNRFKTQLGEDRGVENVQNARNLSPYSGHSDAALSEIERQRGISDRQREEDYLNRQANVTGDLANLQNSINEKYSLMQQMAPDEADKMFQEIKKDERAYELMQRGELRNDYLANSQLNNTSFQQSLAGYNANRAAFEADRGFGLQEGQLTGNYQGTPTLAAQQFGQQQKKDNWGAYLDSVGLTGNLGGGPMQDWGFLGGTDGPPSYEAQQDAIKNNQWQQGYQMDAAKLQQQAQQFAASQGMDWARLNQDQQQFVMNMALQQDKFNWDKQQAQNSPKLANGATLMDEQQGLADALRSGKMTPATALQQIDQDTQLGFYTPEQATQLKSVITTLTPALPSSTQSTLTPEQQKNMPTDAEIDKLYETQGKPSGAASLDWRAWYKSPTGRPAGVPFPTWKQLYGPRFGSGK